MICRSGVEWNFVYVLPGEENKDKILVVLVSLQMRWKLSLVYFCTAIETSRDVSEQYINAPVVTLLPHPLKTKSQKRE